jgi:DNA-directed RNA polymerase specialized sigma24 family protein
MPTQHFGVSPEDHDPDPEETLVRLNTFIVALVGRKARFSSNFARPEVFDLEVDEMVQRVRYKFWGASQVRRIEHPEAYLRTIVSNEFNDLSRKPRRPLPLLTDDDGELYLGDAQEFECARTVDPADEFEESESLDELMDSAAAALAKLSPRQQQAMICELNEKIGATLQLIQALRNHRVEVETIDWPADEADRKLLKASLSHARHKMIECLGLDPALRQKKA